MIAEARYAFLRLLKKISRSAAGSDTGFTDVISCVIRLYDAVCDMITIATLRLTVKPMFKNKVTIAEPIPRRCSGRAPITPRKLGAKNNPVPMPRSTM